MATVDQPRVRSSFVDGGGGGGGGDGDHDGDCNCYGEGDGEITPALRMPTLGTRQSYSET